MFPPLDILVVVLENTPAGRKLIFSYFPGRVLFPQNIDGVTATVISARSCRPPNQEAHDQDDDYHEPD